MVNSVGVAVPIRALRGPSRKGKLYLEMSGDEGTNYQGLSRWGTRLDRRNLAKGRFLVYEPVKDRFNVVSDLGPTAYAESLRSARRLRGNLKRLFPKMDPSWRDVSSVRLSKNRAVLYLTAASAPKSPQIRRTMGQGNAEEDVLAEVDLKTGYVWPILRVRRMTVPNQDLPSYEDGCLAFDRTRNLLYVAIGKELFILKRTANLRRSK